jgi:hypothetical protein
MPLLSLENQELQEKELPIEMETAFSHGKRGPGRIRHSLCSMLELSSQITGFCRCGGGTCIQEGLRAVLWSSRHFSQLQVSVESLIKLPHRTKTEWLKHNAKNIETKLKSDREKKIAMAEWATGQLRWNPETDISTAGSSRPPAKPKHKATPKPKDITSVHTMKWNPTAPTRTAGTHKPTKKKIKGNPQRKGAPATGKSTRAHSTPWATNPQPEAPQGGASSAAAAPPPSISHIALPLSTDLARSNNSSPHTDADRAGNPRPQAPTRHPQSSSTKRSHSRLSPQTPLQADDPDIQHIDRFI